ncbi:Uncharacterised protein [Vibrio cholerae]|nr:Uncharacterised protein [Vibrio cholerae]
MVSRWWCYAASDMDVKLSKKGLNKWRKGISPAEFPLKIMNKSLFN